MNGEQTQTLPRAIGSSSSVVLPPINNVDPSVVKVLHAIRQVESGGDYNAVGDNGASLGAFQWNNGKTPLKPGETPVNWQNAAKEFLGSADAPMTQENQNYVAYNQIAKYKAQGLSPNSIDALWNGAHADPNNPGQYIHNNQDRLTKFNQALSGDTMQSTPQESNQPQQQEPSPSVGGYGENVIKSGANFVGNVGNAFLHPIDTVQNIGGAAVGGVQELGGQSNENTQKWDALKNFFIERYKSPEAIAHTLYTDPVGFAADISAVLGVGGGVLGALGKGAELSGLGTAARVGTEVAPAVEATGVAGGLGEAAGALGRAAELTNPLTPIIKGAGALINKSTKISDIIKNPQDYTPENIANSSATKIGEDAQAAFDAQRASLSETGAAYQPMRQKPVPVPTAPAFLDNTLRDTLKLSVEDGIIKATGDSLIRNSADISKLQQVYNTYKPYFLSDSMDSNRFLNLRSDLGKLAYNDLGIKNSTVASAAEQVRNSLNEAYRPQIQGLTKLDANYSSKINKINELEDGLVYKTGAHKGEIKDSFISKANKALKTGNDAQISQMEEIIPGITKRLQVMKTIQDLSKPGLVMPLLEKGGILGGLATGNLQIAAAALSTMILQNPEIALPLMRAIGASAPLVKAVMTNLAKYATISAVGNNALSMPTPQETGQLTQATPEGQTQPTESSATQGNQGVLSSTDSTTVTPALQALADSHKFNIKKAVKDGVSLSDIEQYLIKLK